MLERGELSQITANAELADRLLATARQHLASARLLADTDPYLAYVAAYDAIRKALSALLQIQGPPRHDIGRAPGGHAPRSQCGSDLARPAGFEPATRCLEGSCSVRLSYGRPQTIVPGKSHTSAT